MASGDRVVSWDAIAGTPPSTNFAVLKETTVDNYKHLCYEFTAGTNLELQFRDVLVIAPPAGGITFRIAWATTDNSTGNCTWEVALERATSVDAPSFGTAQTGFTAGTGTTGDVVVTTVAFTSGQLPAGLVKGDVWRALVRRVTGGYAGNPQLLSVEVVET